MSNEDLGFVLEMWPLSDNTDDHISSHHLLLRDQVRNRAFQKAIHRLVNPGDVVLEIGAGTGILSAFALQAGARHIYLTETEDTISCAQEILNNAGWRDRVTCIRSRAEGIRITGRRVDLIIVELIGSFGIDENILEVLPPVRNRALRNEGIIVPSRLRLFVAPIAYRAFRRELKVYRSIRHGIDLSPLAPLADNNVYLIDLRNARFLSDPAKLIEFDLLTCTENTLQRRCEFIVKKPGTLIGIAGWFEVDLAPGITLSNEPKANRTHWDQVVFPVGEPISVDREDRVWFQIHYEGPKAGDEWRWSGSIETRTGRRRFRFSSENRFPFPRIRSRRTLRIR